eukprot:TRINITY_DN3027_c0_g1_i2.p1 TRINITY_DN3027_c0_g1~~TRINITY_DN3027_c0_g1_i2.p1  ORF type:complete len:175 (-),score=29.13 TRINITY_DN3027_c0_g1_i2:39-563(-)
MGAEVYPLEFKLNFGEIKMLCQANIRRCFELRDSFYENSKVVVILFDLTLETSYKNIPVWFRSAKRVCGENAPVVIVGNKADDIVNRKIKAKRITFAKEKGLFYFEISAISNYNVENLFLQILKLVIGVRNRVEFVEKPLLFESITNLDLDVLNQFRKEYDEYTIPIIEDEDDL